ncbi:MAG: amidohydrolase family protein [Thermodesulfobacteriota bacterium]
MQIKTFIVGLLPILLILACSNTKSDLLPPGKEDDELVIFHNVNLVPMTDDKALPNRTVIVQGDRIIAIGPSEINDIPENAKVIDGNGRYLMPGLADMHIHTYDNWNTWPVSPLKLYLANGVTTIRCFGPQGGDQKHALRWRDKISKGELIGPFIYACGPILYGPVDNPQKRVLEQAEADFDFIKLYSYLSMEDFQMAMATAKQGGMHTAGHIPMQIGLDETLSGGMNEIAHIEELAWGLFYYDKRKKIAGRKWMSYFAAMAYKQYKQLYQDLDAEELNDKIGSSLSIIATKVKTADVPVCTTLFLDEVILDKLFNPDGFIMKPENIFLPKHYHTIFNQGREKHQVQFKGGEDFAPFKHKLDLLILSYLKASNVFLVLGTDSGTGGMGIVPGYSVHEELRILVENGYTPFEALKTGTVNAGLVVEKMNGQGNFGTIDIGNRADLILVENNPLEDVANVRSIMGVMAAGRWYGKTALDDMIN